MEGLKVWHILAGGAAIIAAFYLLHPSTSAAANPGAGIVPMSTSGDGRTTVTLGGFKAYPPARPMVSKGPVMEARAGLAHF